MERTRARTLARITFAIAATLAVPMPAVIATSAEAQLVTQEDRCRADLAKTSRKYLERVLKYRMKCQAKLIVGDLPLATDCLEGNGDDVLAGQLARAEARLSVGGRDCNGVNLQLLGFPNVCEDDNGFPFDTGDFQQCVLERTDEILGVLLDYYYPPMSERARGDVAACIKGTPTDAAKSLRGKMRGREKCLVGQDYAVVDEQADCYAKIRPYGSGTGDEGADRALSGAYSDLLGEIPKACALIQINDLGYQDACPDATGGVFNIFDLKNCLFEQNRVATLAGLATVFPTEGICGDGNVQGEEECDDGIAGNSNTIPNACRTDCTFPDCGDGVFDTEFEGCDDGNATPNDCCTDCVVDRCGDGATNCNEECDDGDGNNSDTTPNACRLDCTDPVCGDEVTDPSNLEECDDGNTTNEDGCTEDCIEEFCGDEIIQEGIGEECDDGVDNAAEPNKCRPMGHEYACQLPFCGDGITDNGQGFGEVCDDGNTLDGDTCSSTCAICGDGIQGPGEECDNNNAHCALVGEACQTNCDCIPVCGDGMKAPSEQCDSDDNHCPGGEQCQANCECLSICPTVGELVLYAGVGLPCSINSDCAVGVCSDGACHTVTRLDSGWTGAAHNADINDGVKTRGFLQCSAHDEPCGECTVEGIDPSTRNCRCLNNSRTICDDPFAESASECLACAAGDLAGRTCTANVDCESVCSRRCSQSPTTKCSSNADCTGVGTCPTQTTCADGNTNPCTTNGDCETSTCTGTAGCGCFFGAPFPLSSEGTPACIVNRFSEAPFGTANVDLGAGEITARLRTQVHLGILTYDPCPSCGGKCSNAATTFCNRDEDCPVGGTCNDDPVPDDGIRGGVCSTYPGSDSGKPCDASAFNSSFPARREGPSGGWYSIDCLPNNNVSGTGLVINLTQTTGTSSLTAQVSCLGQSPQLDCHCLVCTGDPSVPCNNDTECSSQQGSCTLSATNRCNVNTDCDDRPAGICQGTSRCQFSSTTVCSSNADCAAVDVGPCIPSTCSRKGSGSSGTFPLPNACLDQACSDTGQGYSECTVGPDSTFCEGIVKSNGTGILSCFTDESCAPGQIGIDARPCGLVQRKQCFLDTISATGDPDPATPIGAAVFCIPPTGNSAINDVAGLPGPGRVVNQAKAKTFCGEDPTKQYIPGVGGCLDE